MWFLSFCTILHTYYPENVPADLTGIFFIYIIKMRHLQHH